MSNLSQPGWGSGCWPAHQGGREPCLTHTFCVQKYKKAKKPSPATTRPVSRRCAITARNALTALFTSSGRSHTQPGIQDTAKHPSKVTDQPPQPPPPRRSNRLKT